MSSIEGGAPRGKLNEIKGFKEIQVVSFNLKREPVKEPFVAYVRGADDGESLKSLLAAGERYLKGY